MILYEGLFVKPKNLFKRFDPFYNKKFGHHVTLQFKPEKILHPDRLGESVEIKITGRLITDKADLLLVMVPFDFATDRADTTHITLSCNNYPPEAAFLEVKKFLYGDQQIDNSLEDFIYIPLNKTVQGVYGYFEKNKIVKG